MGHSNTVGRTRSPNRKYILESDSRCNSRNTNVTVQNDARCFAQHAGFTHHAKGVTWETFRDKTKTEGSAQAHASTRQNGTRRQEQTRTTRQGKAHWLATICHTSNAITGPCHGRACLVVKPIMCAAKTVMWRRGGTIGAS